MFFPQIVIPLLAFYFVFCKMAWDHGRTRDYVALAVIQIATFVSFPYGSVFMGLATLIFLSLVAKRSDLRVNGLNLSSEDLLIAPAKDVDDVSTAVRF